jgi:hypothetical protein
MVGGRYRAATFVLLTAASACRSAPSKPSLKPAAADAGAPHVAAVVSAVAPSALSQFIDKGFPGEDQPELVTARRLFPSAFGFGDGRFDKVERTAYPYSDALFEGIESLPSHCLNSLAQPSIADFQLDLLRRTGQDEQERGFVTNEAIVLKDRATHYVLAISKEAAGALILPRAAVGGLHDEDPTDVSFLVVLSDVTVIYPNGKSLQLGPGEKPRTGGATLSVTTRGRVRLCADDLRYRAKGCSDSDDRVRAADAPPRDFDLRRCEAGCELACSRAERQPRPCPSSPAPICLGSEQRVFGDGRDVGGYCVFDEWDIQCASGCHDGRCAEAPTVAWSRAIGKGYQATALDADTIALTEDETLVTLSADGQILARDRTRPNVGIEVLLSDGQGRGFSLDRLGELRAVGKAPFRRPQEEGGQPADMQYRDGDLYVAHGEKLTCLDASDGHEKWHVELGAEAKPLIAASSTSVAIITAKQELVVVDRAGALRGRAMLAEPCSGRFLVEGDQVTLYTESGKLLSGRFDALSTIAHFPRAEWGTLGLTKLGSGAGNTTVALLNVGTDSFGQTKVHALELPKGRELWSYSVSGELKGSPLVDRYGNVLLVGRMLTSLTLGGALRFRVDFRGPPQADARAFLGLDGTSLYLRDHRALTKLTGL